MASPDLHSILRDCAHSIEQALEGQRGRGYSGIRDTQYHLDLAADAAGLAVLHGAGFRVVSEESGVTGSGDYTVVMDPIDGSTNCDRGIPFYATSLAVLKDDELVAGLVVNLATNTYYEAERGAGATRDGMKISVSSQEDLAHSIVSFSGWPHRRGGWSQFRAMGAASLECCLVGDGSLDGFSMAHGAALNPWDYLAGLLIVKEAGGSFVDLNNDELITSQSQLRRPVFAATSKVLNALVNFDRH